MPGEREKDGNLAPGAWYYPDVRGAYEGGLLNGTDAGKFSPDAPVSRAMAVQALYNLALAEGSVEAGEGGPEWYSAALSWARNSGVAEGMAADGFIPDRALSRQELAELLFRYETLARGNAAAPAPLSGFTDAGEAYAFAETALGWAAGTGLLQGTGGGRLSPTDPLTRAQLAAVLRRFGT